jgi:hypothetical protein
MKIILIAIGLLLLWSPITHAQETTANEKNSDTVRREKALELLKSLATQVGSLQSPENRARIGANIAESLWKHDENRARALFIGIEDDIKLGLQNRKISDAADRLTVSVFLKLRGDTVQRIAKYDPEFALDFLNATEPEPHVGEVTGLFTEAQHNVEIQLAKKIAATNPDIALKLGRQALARGFSGELLSLLRQLFRKHRDKGLTLYKETVQKLRDADLLNDEQALWFAVQLAESLPPPAADGSAFRELINTLIATALAKGCDKKSPGDVYIPFCGMIGSLVATMENVDPVRGGRLKHLARFKEEHYEWLERPYIELKEIAEDGSVDEILQLAQKYPRLDATIYSRAVAKAYEGGDIERAQKIANSFPGAPEGREFLVTQLKSMMAAAEITEEELAAAQKQLAEIRVDRNRIYFLNELADRVGPKNRKLALKLLDQAAELSEEIKAPDDKIAALFSLAMAYCKAGSERGLDMIESQIPKLNELIDAAVKLDGFDTRYLRDGEWNMSANGCVGSLLTALSESAGNFASCDFDRAVALAGQFERSEIRIMAQVKLAQSILAGPTRRNRYQGDLPY